MKRFHFHGFWWSFFGNAPFPFKCLSTEATTGAVTTGPKKAIHWKAYQKMNIAVALPPHARFVLLLDTFWVVLDTLNFLKLLYYFSELLFFHRLGTYTYRLSLPVPNSTLPKLLSQQLPSLQWYKALPLLCTTEKESEFLKSKHKSYRY